MKFAIKEWIQEEWMQECVSVSFPFLSKRGELGEWMRSERASVRKAVLRPSVRPVWWDGWVRCGFERSWRGLSSGILSSQGINKWISKSKHDDGKSEWVNVAEFVKSDERSENSRLFEWDFTTPCRLFFLGEEVSRALWWRWWSAEERTKRYMCNSSECGVYTGMAIRERRQRWWCPGIYADVCLWLCLCVCVCARACAREREVPRIRPEARDSEPK